MNALVDFLRRQTDDTPDRELVRRFADTRDNEAFGELVRRHGPVVFGVCRRMLANTHDAEDAFQATFLVLVRRANQLTDHEPLGPWLFQVAVLTARNVRRGNRRRAAVSLVEQDVPGREVNGSVADVDLDPALLALPEKYRAPLVLCYLQGLSRREAAARLGCPEGTLSALLNRALKKLRDRLGVAPAALLAIAASAAVPSELAAATTRAAIIYATSSLGEAGVSPAVAELTRGVLTMKKPKAVYLFAALLVTGALAVSAAAGWGNPDDPPPKPPVAETPQKKADPMPNLEDDRKDLVPVYVTGTVKDSDGKPIVGARVAKNTTLGYTVTGSFSEFSGTGVTDRDGTYTIKVRTKPGRAVYVLAMSVEAEGFVAHREDFKYDEVKTSPDNPGRWDFVLARGDLIAGTVAEADPGDRIPVIVRGPSFTRTVYTGEGGTFRLWVPKGRYTVTAAVHVKYINRDPGLKGTEYESGAIIKRAAVAKDVASGTEGLVLKAP